MANLKKTGNVRAAGNGAGPGLLDGRSVGQARFEIDRGLREVRGRLEAAYQTMVEPDPQDMVLEKKLEKELAAI